MQCASEQDLDKAALPCSQVAQHPSAHLSSLLPAQGCYEAFKRRLNTSHAVSCVPGTSAVTAKAALVTSLAAAYGQAAWSILPQSFRLPQQYSELAAQLKEDERSGASGMWVLKEDVHRGKGVGVVTAHQALFRALERAPDGGRRHVLAQRFLGQQYLVQGRPFYVRWAPG